MGRTRISLSEGGMRLVEWYVRIDRKRYSVRSQKREWNDSFKHVRRRPVAVRRRFAGGQSRAGISHRADATLCDRQVGPWSSRAPKGSIKAASRERASHARAQYGSVERIRGRLDHVNAEHAARDREEKARLEEAARTRRAGAHVAKKWNLLRDTSENRHHNSFETRVRERESIRPRGGGLLSLLAFYARSTLSPVRPGRAVCTHLRSPRQKRPCYHAVRDGTDEGRREVWRRTKQLWSRRPRSIQQNDRRRRRRRR